MSLESMSVESDIAVEVVGFDKGVDAIWQWSSCSMILPSSTLGNGVLGGVLATERSNVNQDQEAEITRLRPSSECHEPRGPREA
jgi:hypothetical protein